MQEYHKIDSVFKRDMDAPSKKLIVGAWTTQEFEYLAQSIWSFTEKVDGTNIRVMIENGSVSFGGKTDSASIPAQLVKRLQALFLPQADYLNAQFPRGACLYGEGYGAKIQKGGGNYRPDQDFVLFDVKIDGWWLNRDAVDGIGRNVGCDVVPSIGAGTLNEAVQIVRGGFRSAWGEFMAEGIVARPMVELRCRNGDRIITKIKTRDFDPA